MAISQSAISAVMKSKLSFERSSSHYKGDDMLNAISKAVQSEFTSSAIIIVNSGGGGLYPILGVSEAALESAIKGNLSINMSGKYSKGGVMVKAAAKGIAAALAVSKVAVPSMTGGAFPPIGFNGVLIKVNMLSALAAGGIDVHAEHSRAMEMVDAISDAVASVVSSTGVFLANGVSGGTFKMS